jgi:GTP 3',8-cyclase
MAMQPQDDRSGGSLMHVSMRILLTERCNLSCFFCHNEGQDGQQRVLQLAPKRLTQIIRGLSSNAHVQVKFSGGEPTSHPLLGSFLSGANDAGVSDIVIISNGVDTSVFERLVGHHRFRASLNVPAGDDSEYHRITGGSVDGVLRTAQLLADSGIVTTFNTYWPVRRPANRLRAVLKVAHDVGATAKVLVPCQVIDPVAQEEAVARIGHWLAGEGFVFREELGHVNYYAKDDFTVRVQRPWCPVYCAALADRSVTVRITAVGEIRACLGEGGRTFGSVWQSIPKVRKDIACAIASAGRECSVTPIRPRIVIRPRRGRHQ